MTPRNPMPSAWREQVYGPVQPLEEPKSNRLLWAAIGFAFLALLFSTNPELFL